MSEKETQTPFATQLHKASIEGYKRHRWQGRFTLLMVFSVGELHGLFPIVCFRQSTACLSPSPEICPVSESARFMSAVKGCSKGTEQVGSVLISIKQFKTKSNGCRGRFHKQNFALIYISPQKPPNFSCLLRV